MIYIRNKKKPSNLRLVTPLATGVEFEIMLPVETLSDLRVRQYESGVGGELVMPKELTLDERCG